MAAWSPQQRSALYGNNICGCYFDGHRVNPLKWGEMTSRCHLHGIIKTDVTRLGGVRFYYCLSYRALLREGTF
jgi:hypothetical protein